jgi:hypothetical protein
MRPRLTTYACYIYLGQTFEKMRIFFVTNFENASSDETELNHLMHVRFIWVKHLLYFDQK